MTPLRTLKKALDECKGRGEYISQPLSNSLYSLPLRGKSISSLRAGSPILMQCLNPDHRGVSRITPTKKGRTGVLCEQVRSGLCQARKARWNIAAIVLPINEFPLTARHRSLPGSGIGQTRRIITPNGH